jgi:hypothetical protein
MIDDPKQHGIYFSTGGLPQALPATPPSFPQPTPPADRRDSFRIMNGEATQKIAQAISFSALSIGSQVMTPVLDSKIFLQSFHSYLQVKDMRHNLLVHVTNSFLIKSRLTPNSLHSFHCP